MTTKVAIENRRSIRKFKADPVSDEIITTLLESARLAPSGCNAQPWRFKIVRDEATKRKLQTASYDQAFVSEAPVVLVVCADIRGYLDGRVSGVEDLGRIGAFDDRIVEILNKKTKVKSQMEIESLRASVAFNVAIAIEHIVLTALDFGLGSCWMKLIDAGAISEIFGWDTNTHPVALLPLGYPAEFPTPRKRRSLNDIIID
ncbi:MAG: nitroreductase family protein [Planctomycetes bacterium]|nr:nitroreductase family protein [Planctomycetota bacterium]